MRIGEARVIHDIRTTRRIHDVPVIDALLEDGRFLNRMETGGFPDGMRDSYFRTRIMSEFKLYGARTMTQDVLQELPDRQRPLYGLLDFVRDPEKSNSLGYWGDYRFVLKEEVKYRATYTPRDSFVAEWEEVYPYEDIEGVLVAKPAGTKYWFEYVLDQEEPRPRGGRYIEAQIFGPVWLTDVERLYLPAAVGRDSNLRAKLSRLGVDYNIELVQY